MIIKNLIEAGLLPNYFSGINTKLEKLQKGKPIIIEFNNKLINKINLNRIIKHPDTVKLWPCFNNLEKYNTPTIFYKYDRPLGSALYNYRQTCTETNIVKWLALKTPCNCSKSPFMDKHHKHIITCDLSFIENKKLRFLLEKGPKYRLPKPINKEFTLNAIKNGIINCLVLILIKPA